MVECHMSMLVNVDEWFVGSLSVLFSYVFTIFSVKYFGSLVFCLKCYIKIVDLTLFKYNFKFQFLQFPEYGNLMVFHSVVICNFPISR